MSLIRVEMSRHARRSAGELWQHDMSHVAHDAIVQLQDCGRVSGRASALRRRSRVDVVLRVAVGAADVDLMPGNVRMAEDHYIRMREPTAETGRSAVAMAAVVEVRDSASVEFDDKPLWQDHAAVVVAEHRPHRRE